MYSMESPILLEITNQSCSIFTAVADQEYCSTGLTEVAGEELTVIEREVVVICG